MADEVAVVPGRLAAATPARFGGTFSFFAAVAAVSFAGDGFSVSVSTSDVIPVVSPSDRTSAGTSSAWLTSGASTSAILLEMEDIKLL